MTHVIRIATLSGLFLLGAACSSSTPTTEDSQKKTPSDKTTQPSPTDPSPSDPSPTDPSPSEPSKAAVGALCTMDADCAANLCVFEGSSPRGVCSKLCNNITDCPGGSTAWDGCGQAENVTGKVCLPKR